MLIGNWRENSPGSLAKADSKQTGHLVNATQCRVSGCESAFLMDPFITLDSMSVQELASLCLGQMSLQVIDDG